MSLLKLIPVSYTHDIPLSLEATPYPKAPDPVLEALEPALFKCRRTPVLAIVAVSAVLNPDIMLNACSRRSESSGHGAFTDLRRVSLPTVPVVFLNHVSFSFSPIVTASPSPSPSPPPTPFSPPTRTTSPTRPPPTPPVDSAITTTATTPLHSHPKSP